MLSLAFAKLVATPTEESWSQVYNAGNLFASLSLSKKDPEENASLQAFGKEMFATLESEFFTLEEKNLTSIKEALANSTHAIPSNITASLCLAYFKDNILYLFIYGAGTIIMKRGGKIGILLDKKTDSPEIISGSGFLENRDVIVLQTPQFAKDMPEDIISSSLELDLPNDIAETLSPAMHEKDDAGQAAIIIKYQGSSKPIAENSEDIDQSTDIIEQQKLVEIVSDNLHIPAEQIEVVDQYQETKPEMPERLNTPKLAMPAFLNLIRNRLQQKPAFLKNKFGLQLNHRKKLFLSIAVIIVVILIASILLTKKKQSETKESALFQSIYDPALKNYQDGVGIKSINSDFAHEDFLKAESTLKDGDPKFTKGSSEEKQIADLLGKVESELGGSASTNTVKAQIENVDTNEFLNVEKANSDGLSFAKDANATYFVTAKTVTSVDSNGTKKDIIKNDGDWTKAVGISVYQGNIYILDQQKGVLKFVAGSGGFGKTSYFKDSTPDLSSAQALAIDGSVWILFKDGTISKFTKGVSDGFQTKGLDQPLASPTKLFTDINTENLYVLDSSNSRIVKLGKDGSFQKQYNADILKDAKDFEVSEKNGNILILSGGKVWQIAL